MASKRYDKKGRVLQNGEYQKADGRYEYRYTDSNGEKRSVYAWRLTESDKAPSGKNSKDYLRGLEAAIKRDLMDGVNSYEANRRTVDDLFELSLQVRSLKQTTVARYRANYDLYIKPRFGSKWIGDIKHSDILKFFIELLDKKGLKPNTVATVYTILSPAFNLAVRDRLIRSNPAQTAYAEVRRKHDFSKQKKRALTIEQQQAFLRFIKNSRLYCRWGEFYTVLLGTGMRIGEISALCWDDCDFEKGVINVCRSLSYIKTDGGFRNVIETPKTRAGVRQIPMPDTVRAALIRERECQYWEGGLCEVEIDGCSGFVFTNRAGGVMNENIVNQSLNRAIRRYNEEERVKAENEGRKPILLPKFSPHIFRHTYCTRLCENVGDEVTLKTIQSVMGHSSITMTMDIYNDLTEQKKRDAFESLKNKIAL